MASPSGWHARVLAFVGPMFSEKTRKAMIILRMVLQDIRADTELKAVLIKPTADTRGETPMYLTTHDDQILADFEAIVFDPKRPGKIYLHPQIEEADIVVIEEGQFFSEKLASIIHLLYRAGIFVVYIALDKDFRGVPFLTTEAVLALKETEAATLTAICDFCHGIATESIRYVGGHPANGESPVVAVEGDQIDGQEVTYNATCVSCAEVFRREAGIKAP